MSDFKTRLETEKSELEEKLNKLDANTLLPTVRPAMVSEALQLLKEGKEIEIHNEMVFELMRYLEKAEQNLKLRFRFNRDNEGWTIVCPNCW